jgi:hypothetical protein
VEFYRTVVERLAQLAKKARFDVRIAGESSGSDWMKVLVVNPAVRLVFSVEGETSGIVGMIVVPELEKEHINIARNRFNPPLPSNIEILEREGYDGKKLAVVVIQIWERVHATVLIPAKQLRNTKTYRDTGNFRVINNGGEFRLQAARYEPEIRLKDRLQDLLAFMP